ncbi:hypothetical protein HMPREF9080_00001 [Cardiobacterium valvarum F0432]|uniref:Uncharacterized protein n=1 Tax=Cardiobacterium valvarum F0432 TaxID=797473 RepID=G9ZB79_9GAMM|nr:hypothetical protein HMPREF9080_00001 [Cardiobacterium valvarum F0432]
MPIVYSRDYEQVLSLLHGGRIFSVPSGINVGLDAITGDFLSRTKD